MHGQVKFLTGNGGLPMLRIESSSSVAEIYLHGAHVTHFQRHGERPLLWMSRKAQFAPGKAIRGGIPVILPWFGPKDNAPAHGFARMQNWELAEVSHANHEGVSVRFTLPASAEMSAYGLFGAEYTVTVGNDLQLELAVVNGLPDRDISIEDCLHTYFAIGDTKEISISGLKGTQYLDKVGGSAEKNEPNETITINSEVDRVYMDTTSTVEILDRKLQRKIRVKKEGSNSTIVWNPWIDKAKAMTDFGDEEYREMVCVESGNVGKNHLTLAPGKSATMWVRLSTEKLL